MGITLAHTKSNSYKYLVTPECNISSRHGKSKGYDTVKQMQGYGWDTNQLYSEGLAEWT